MKTILAIDINAPAIQAYHENFPGVDARVADVRECEDILVSGMADLVTGGFPCQPHSLAGQREASKDERDCGPDFVEAVRLIQPRHFLGENVPGILSSEGGRYVQRLVASMIDAGYVVEVKELDSVNFGVPQFRRRIWFWGIRADLYRDGMRHIWPVPTHQWPPPEGCLFGKALLPGITVAQALNLHGDIWRKRGQGMLDRAGGRRDHPTTEPSPSVTGAFGQGGSGGLFVKVRNGQEKNVSGTMQQVQEVDGAEPLESCGDQQGYGEPPALPDLRSSAIRDDGGNVPSLTIKTHRGPEWAKTESERTIDEPSPAVTAGSRSGGHDGLYLQSHADPAVSVDQPSTTRSGGDGHDGCCLRLQVWGGDDALHPADEPIGTLRAGEAKGGKASHFMAYKWSDAMLAKHPPASPASPASTIQAKFFKGGAEGLLAYGPWKRKGDLWVRRLTVPEVMRLQSMPDDYRWPEKFSKTNAYRCVGNGQACEQTRVLGIAIRAVDPECLTAVSLFCGAGLGDCGFESRSWRYELAKAVAV